MNTFYRVANRLVHGQSSRRGCPAGQNFPRSQRYVPDNSLQMTMFRMAIPKEVNYLAMGIDEAAAWLNDNRYCGETIMVLIETIQDASRLFRAGHPFPNLNT